MSKQEKPYISEEQEKRDGISEDCRHLTGVLSQTSPFPSLFSAENTIKKMLGETEWLLKEVEWLSFELDSMRECAAEQHLRADGWRKRYDEVANREEEDGVPIYSFPDCFPNLAK